MSKKKLIISIISAVLCLALIVCGVLFIPDIVKTQKSMSKYEDMNKHVASGDYKSAISVLYDDFEPTTISKRVPTDTIYTTILQSFELAINAGDFTSAWQVIDWLRDDWVFPNIHKNPRIYPDMVNSNLQNYFKSVSFTNEEEYEAYVIFVTGKLVELYNNDSSLLELYSNAGTYVTPFCERDFSHVLWMYTLLPQTNENRKCAEAIMAALIEQTYLDSRGLINEHKKIAMEPLIEEIEKYDGLYIYDKMMSETKFFRRLSK
jgi:hypothetical protein